MYTHNPRAHRTEYPAELHAILNMTAAHQSRDWLAHWSHINMQGTPLYDMPHLAAYVGVARIHIKDESVRSPLASFKALGAPIALIRLVVRHLPHLDVAGLFAGAYGTQLTGFTVISATDGNHGRALAAAAQAIGCRCVIVIHAQVSVEREQAIAAYGAEVIRITGNYDDSVRVAAQMADTNGWYVVSDTSYAGYTDIPRDVMQGYSIIAAEAIAQRGGAAPWTHVFLQGGVGGFAAGVASYLWQYYGAQRPRLIVVEPEQADCLYQSALVGYPALARGSVDSVMAGLACGETSPLAWQILAGCIDDFMTVSDDEAVAAMRIVASGAYGDIPLVGGESGVAGLAGLIHLCRNTHLSAQLGLDHTACVLVINTEGATAPSVYHELAGVSVNDVRTQQLRWTN
ncbi:MAG: diaminopropionate ammonia-lyase [Roseiflexaceae bacterium]|jgi:diaminopropionate ammonia-lyase